MQIFEPDFMVPFLIFMIPLVAIVGGITAGIVRTLGRQRLIELAQQERIAAIQRGLDPSQLAPISPEFLSEAGPFSAEEQARRQHRGLLIGGVVTLFAGIGMGLFFAIVKPDNNDNMWAVALIPVMIGLGLLLAAALVRPRANGRA
jgi:hypothetical protein